MSAPAGWYDDGSGRHRWWDGQKWTEQVKDIPSQTLEMPKAELVESKVASEYETPSKADRENSREPSIFAKFGASVKKAAADRQSAKDDLQREYVAREQAAGKLLTSGVFGSSTIQIFEGGYVRVAGPSDTYIPEKVDRKTPYEKLLSITFTPPAQPSSTGASAPLEDATVQAVATLIKGGTSLLKASVPGLAATGVTQIAKSMSGKSFLAIATDKEIHTLTNQVKNEWGIPLIKKEHEEVGRTLKQVGNSVLKSLGMPVPDVTEDAQPAAASPAGALNGAAAANQPTVASTTISERLRELASLHADGVLDDAEFASAKAKVLANL